MTVTHSREFVLCGHQFTKPPLGPRMVYDYGRQEMVRDAERDALNAQTAGYAHGFCIWAMAHEANGVAIQPAPAQPRD